jgi:hypothetical protein
MIWVDLLKHAVTVLYPDGLCFRNAGCLDSHLDGSTFVAGCDSFIYSLRDRFH